MPKGKIPRAERRATQEPVGRTIKLVARARGVPLVELADRIDDSEQSLHGRLRGAAPLELAMLERIARALGVGADELLRPELPRWAARDSNPEPADFRSGEIFVTAGALAWAA